VPSTFTVLNLNNSGAGSLRAAVVAANASLGADTIAFAGGLHGTITLTSGELAITDSVTIDGPGANSLSVSGNLSSRVFDIGNNATVAIDRLTIADGFINGGNGGGILVDAGATLNLDHVVMTGNNAHADSLSNFGNGGGIENDGSLAIAESSFVNNNATGGSFKATITGAITEGSAGGAIDSQGPYLTVTSSAFTNNGADGYNVAAADPFGTSEGNGGAINNSSAATITNSTFTGNGASGRTTNGGAISTGENELTNPANDPLAISNCTFTGNVAVGGDNANDYTHSFGGQALGGAIANAAPLTIANSSFTDNVAKAGDHCDNLTTFNGHVLVGSAWGGGIVNSFGGSLTVTHTNFAGNQAIGGNSAAGVGGTAEGGGVDDFIFATTTLTDVSFVGNQAVGGSGGPGYTGGTGFGGALSNNVDSTAAIAHTLFLDNQAQGGAGGLGAAGGVGAGGAIANGGGSGALESVYLGLPSDNSSYTLDHGTLVLNVAQGGAGGAGGNGGSGLGGGAFVLGTCAASNVSSEIVVNAAFGGSPGAGGASGQGEGGGLYIDSGATVYLDSFTVNSAKNNDAAIDPNIDGTYILL
jgi:hypothetical protein